MAESLTRADLALICRVAARRVGVQPDDVSAENLEAAAAWPDTLDDGAPRFSTPFARAAAQAEAASRVVSAGAPLTALLALAARLWREGYVLLAPQGVLAGMVAGMVAGRVDVDALGRWIEDRAVLASGG